jgi:methionyl-tRNA synthetase
MIKLYQDNIIGDIPPADHDVHEYQAALAICRFDRAMDEIWEQVRGLNQYIDTEKPWQIKKSGDNFHLQEVLAYSVSCLMEIAELLKPFMPDTAAKIEYAFKEGIVRQLKAPLFPKKEQST